MNFFKAAWLGTMLLAIFASPATLADDHMLNGMAVSQPFNVQANLCKLNPGVTLDEYDALVEDYFDGQKSMTLSRYPSVNFPCFRTET